MAKTAEKRWFVSGPYSDGIAELCEETKEGAGEPVLQTCKPYRGISILRRCARLLNADDARRREEREDGTE